MACRDMLLELTSKLASVINSRIASSTCKTPSHLATAPRPGRMPAIANIPLVTFFKRLAWANRASNILFGEECTEGDQR